MKKRILFLSALLFCIFAAQSQSAYEGTIKHKKGDKVVAIIELPYSEENAEKAIKENLAKRSPSKMDKINGYLVFKGVKLQEADPELSDVYFKVESKKDKGSIVYCAVGRPGEDISVRTTDDRHKVNEAIDFLNQMVPNVETHTLNVDIDSQEEMVKKAEKKLQNLEEEQQDIEKKIKNLQERLEENKKDQQKQTEEVMKQKAQHEALKTKRKS